MMDDNMMRFEAGNGNILAINAEVLEDKDYQIIKEYFTEYKIDLLLLFRTGSGCIIALRPYNPKEKTK
jgi:hypothetical protein